VIRSLGASSRLTFEALDGAHAEWLHPVLVTEEVLRYIDPAERLSVDELRDEYAARAEDPPESRAPEQWHNAVIRLGGIPIGRLEASSYGHYGEGAYLIGRQWWGHGYALAPLDPTMPLSSYDPGDLCLVRTTHEP
jgi:RimJ/RimL family protein N-acetyltransferase